jgi:hypothetical protein
VSTDSRQTNNYQTIEVRKGQVTAEAFRDRFMARCYDPAFRAEDQSLVRLESIAWDPYCASHKSPITEKAGPEFADPDYDLSVEWRAASERIKAAQKKQKDQSTTSRVPIVNASSRNDYPCPGEMSKSFRLGKLARQTFERHSFGVDFLDLFRLNSDRVANALWSRYCAFTRSPKNFFKAASAAWRLLTERGPRKGRHAGSPRGTARSMTHCATG